MDGRGLIHVLSNLICKVMASGRSYDFCTLRQLPGFYLGLQTVKEMHHQRESGRGISYNREQRIQSGHTTTCGRQVQQYPFKTYYEVPADWWLLRYDRPERAEARHAVWLAASWHRPTCRNLTKSELLLNFLHSVFSQQPAQSVSPACASARCAHGTCTRWYGPECLHNPQGARLSSSTLVSKLLTRQLSTYPHSRPST